jgi:hypothetical protein
MFPTDRFDGTGGIDHDPQGAVARAFSRDISFECHRIVDIKK